MAAVYVGLKAVQLVDKDVVIRRKNRLYTSLHLQITSLMVLARFIIDLLKISYKRVNA